MINKHKTMYSCPICGRQTATLHELFPGWSGRKICIEYSIQIPLCNICHATSHTRDLAQGHSPLMSLRENRGGRLELSKKLIQAELCKHLEIDRDKTSLAVNTNDTEYLEKINGKCEAMIKTFELF